MTALTLALALCQDAPPPGRVERATSYLWLGSLVVELTTDERVHRAVKKAANVLTRPFKRRKK